MNDKETHIRITIEGERSSSDPRYPHVSWACPSCGKWHDTDLAAEDKSPLDLQCEAGRSDEVFSVRWKE